ncbi:MAG: polysialyltransferase family glycosyltransferase [Dehalococcoidia bacterium]|nr:polysialyltransferase family glycosyltransferase [Dehalococcoidia bacterium]
MGDGSIDKVINRVLFCTSPLQVINARSAMDYMESNLKCNDYVVMVHPLLLENTKKQINHIAKILDYSNVIDLTFLEKKYNQEKERLSLIKKIFMIKRLLNDRIEKHIELQGEISDILQKKIGKIDIVFFRMAYKYIDSLFINTQKDATWYGIEDGIGDYVPNNWAFTTFNTYEIKHRIKSVFNSYLFFLTSIFFTSGLKNNKAVFLKPNCNYRCSYTNIERNGSVCISNNFRKNISKLYKKSLQHEKIKVLIIGTLLDPRFKLEINREVKIYNVIIEIISKKYGVNNNEIWYKPHPRLAYESWEFKKNNLQCSIYDYQNITLADVELLNKNLKAVYSIASTILLYAKKIFHLESYLIDIRNEDCHPSAYKQAYYLAKKFDIPTVNV